MVRRGERGVLFVFGLLFVLWHLGSYSAGHGVWSGSSGESAKFHAGSIWYMSKNGWANVDDGLVMT